MVKKLLKTVAAVVLLIVIILISWDQSRSFYHLSDKQHLTVWKRLGNKCFIVPGKYYGILRPKYCIQTTNDNALTIIYENLMDYDYVICNDYGKSVKISLECKKIKYFEYTEKDKFIDEYYSNNQIRDSLKYIQLDVKENLIVINGVRN
jgi:hypothetical protein